MTGSRSDPQVGRLPFSHVSVHRPFTAGCARVIGMARALGAMAVLLLCAACGQPEVRGSDGVPTDLPAPTGTTLPTAGTAMPQLSAAPTSAPPRPCEVNTQIPEPVADAPPPPATGAPPTGTGPDIAPHHPENNRWKQRKPLNAKGVQSGRDAIAKISPVVQRVCESGDFSIDATKKALAQYQPIVEHPAFYATGVSFNITVDNGPNERATCVLGALEPGLVRISIDGTNGEGSCYTPKTR